MLVSPHLIVDVAVGEHGAEVLNALLGVVVIAVLQSLLNGAHVHGILNDPVVVLRERG